MRTLSILCATLLCLNIAQAQELTPIRGRVNIQVDSASLKKVVDSEWVAVGTRKEYAIAYDHTLLYNGKPSYRFTLGEDDNTLQGYSKGETKGRAELSYCYATASDFSQLSASDYDAAQRMKTVYHHGKGIMPQASTSICSFAVYVPSTLSEDVCTIFAQWHGMPDRRLTQSPEGEIRMLSVEEFLELESKMVFKKNIGYNRTGRVDKKGRPILEREPNGWRVEQGGNPPLAFGFTNNYFYIKANSDRKWLSDKDDRCNATPRRDSVMVPLKSEYKASTIAYKLPFGEFPKDCWVRFDVEIDWTEYGGGSEEIIRPGRLDVVMSYDNEERHIVNNEEILIGRNDDDGYYFKFGIYRVAGSTVPVCYNLADYTQISRPFGLKQSEVVEPCDTIKSDTVAVAAPPKKSEVEIACVGDMVLGLNYPDDEPAQFAAEDGAHLFDEVKPWLQRADFTVGNLEGVLLNSGGEPKKVKNTKYRYHFRMPERYAAHFVDAGFDFLAVANNHARDFGMTGLLSTMRTLNSAGIAYAGVKDSCEVAIVERDGLRYGLCAFAPNAAMCNIHDLKLAESLVRKLKQEQGCDLVIVSFHGGAEGSTAYRVPRANETYAGESRGDVYEFAHRCVDAGADLVYGHGPHVVRGIELYNGKIIAYSLGNFCTPYGVNKIGRNGYAPILLVRLSSSGEFLGGEIISALQVDRSGPKHDGSGVVIREIRNLSKSDFPESRLAISDSGELSVKP